MSVLHAAFAIEAEAERALTQLRAAGIRESDITVSGHEDEGMTRDDEVGVPDNAAGLEGLRGQEGEPARPVRMTIDLSASARVDRSVIEHILNAAGGVIE